MKYDIPCHRTFPTVAIGAVETIGQTNTDKILIINAAEL